MHAGARSSAAGSAASSRTRRCATPASSRTRSPSSAREADPPEAWSRTAAAIRQRRMRSESDGHARRPRSRASRAREAVRRRSLVPLRAHACDRYRPTRRGLPRARRASCASETGWDESCAAASGSSASAPSTAGSSWTTTGRSVTSCSRPAIPASPFRPSWRTTRGSSMPTSRTSTRRRVAVVGAGMAAATEWLNALAAGAEVVSVRRREPERRPLNVPRVALHASAASPTSTPRHHASARSCSARSRRRPTRRAAAGTSRSSAPPPTVASGSRPRSNGADQVVCATGFLRGFEHDPLLRRLVDEHGLETDGRWLVLAPDSTVPALTRRRPHAGCRRRRRPVGLSGRGHPRRDEVRGATIRCGGWSRVLHAERPARVEARRGAAAVPRRLRLVARIAVLVAARARRSDDRRRARARRPRPTTAHCPTSPAGSRCRSACSSSV